MASTEGKAIKITLLVMAGLALLLGGSGYGCYRYVRGTMAEEPRAKEEGRAYGESHDARECAFEAVARGKRCWGPTCQILTEKFLVACWAVADPNPKLCEGAPKAASLEAATWPMTTCLHLGAPADTTCHLVVQRVMEYCAARP